MSELLHGGVVNRHARGGCCCGQLWPDDTANAGFKPFETVCRVPGLFHTLATRAVDVPV